MITKDDCIKSLLDIEKTGINIDDYLTSIIVSPEIPLDVLKFILEHKEIEVLNFYEFLRKRHNEKKTPLYKNIVSFDITQPEHVLSILGSLILQIILYGEKLNGEAKTTFLKNSRISELIAALGKAFDNNDLAICIKALKAIQIDLLTLEYIAGKRELKN